MANEGSREMIIIWDFDQTIITDDCDHWVVLDTNLTKLFHRVRDTLSWHQIIVRSFFSLHSIVSAYCLYRKTVNDFVDRLNKFTIDPQMISAIRSAHELGYLLRCEMKVLSDGNHFFIETILKNNGVFECFSGIISNPTVVDEEAGLESCLTRERIVSLMAACFALLICARYLLHVLLVRL
ncbi:putative inorganic diphosphatase [Helianthus annuus]|nr:putative inorganic diphosphatase [Helianthus annuus]